MSLSNERSTLAADPAVANDARARNLILDPDVKIEDARELVAIARRVAGGYRKQGFGAFDSGNEVQALSLKMGTAHVVDGGVQFDGTRQIFGAPIVVRS